MKVIPLSEGAFSVNASKEFVPFNKESDNIQDRERGSLLVEVQPFAVVTNNDVIVLDSGLGFTNEQGILQIHENLIANGIDPMDVTKVLMSHLHKDHSGGLGKSDEILGQRFISFPNAAYYVNEDELNFAQEKGKPSYFINDLEILETATNIKFTRGNGNIDDYISYEVTAGHSPFHQVFWIKEGNETVFFGADDAPQYFQMKNKFMAKYDYDGRKCMELRQKWWEQGKEESWTFLFYHDIKTPVFTF